MLTGPFETNFPGEMPSASALNQMQEALRLAGAVTGDSGTGVRQGSNGLQIFDASAKPFYAKITSGTNPYAWEEVLENAGAFAAYPEGRTGDDVELGDPDEDWPAYEINGAADVAADTYVIMLKASDDDYYWFMQLGGAGSPLTVETADGTTLVIPNVDLIKIGAHLTLSSSGDGEATINVNVASQTVVTNVVCNGDGTITVTTASVLVVV